MLKTKIFESIIPRAKSILKKNLYVNKIINNFIKKEKKIKNKEKEKEKILKNFDFAIKLLISVLNNKDLEKNTAAVYILSGIIYFLMPFDAVPDFIFGVGYIDDFAIFSLVLNLISEDLKIFKIKDKLGKLTEIEIRSVGSLLGLAAGDALGTTLEFSERDYENTLEEIIGGGEYKLNAGEWTDDTSMALCLGQSLLDKGYSPREQMVNYVLWTKFGYLSSNGRCFDIGLTTSIALRTFSLLDKVYAGSEDRNTAGNGSIMRLTPIPIYFTKDGLKEVIKFSGDSSRTTHGAKECIDSCKYLGAIIYSCIKFGNSKDKDFVLFNDEQIKLLKNSSSEKIKITEEKVLSLMNGDWKNLEYDDLPNSGYVIDTMVTALWCFYNTDNFKDALIKAVNLAGDADTIGAVVGQIAGAYYGLNSIPDNWREIIKYSDLIINQAIKLSNKNLKEESDDDEFSKKRLI